jgi:hypothetical protein
MIPLAAKVHLKELLGVIEQNYAIIDATPILCPGRLASRRPGVFRRVVACGSF